MAHFKSKLICCLLASLALSSSFAENLQIKQLAANLKQHYPSTHFGKITSTPINGIYQVIMGKNIAYVEANGRYFLFGNLFDMQQQKDLTGEVKAEMSKIDFSKLPLKNAIKLGNGKNVFAVFSDPECPFCKRLQITLAKMTDYTVYVFEFPIAALHPNSPSTARAIWCAKDKQKAWTEFLLQNKQPPSPPLSCVTPIEQNIQLAESLAMNGTPTIVRRDGAIRTGAASQAMLEAWLKEAK